MQYLPMKKVFAYIKSKEESGQYFFVNERADQLGYLLTRASPPKKKRLIRSHTKANLRGMK